VRSTASVWAEATKAGACPQSAPSIVRVDSIPRPLVLLSALRAGGAERVVVSLVCRLAQRGLRAALCTLSAEHDSPQLVEELQVAGVARYDLAASRLGDPRAPVRYLRLILRQRFDVVHAHGQDAWILASVVRRLVNTPLVLTRHVLDESADTWRESARRRWALAAARHADALVAPSFATADRLGELAGLCASRVHVIPNGIDLEKFEASASASRREEVRLGLGLGTSEKMVVLPAVLRPGKGHTVLLAALPAIRARVPDARVLFVGDGQEGVELRELAQSHGVLFLGHRDDLPDLLRACDLVVLPSFSEALPTVLIEAAAAGRPVVATRVGGTTDIVEHGTTGLLVPPGDPDALAEAIVALLADPRTAEAFGRAGRLVAYARFSLDGHVDRTLDLWSRLATVRRRS